MSSNLIRIEDTNFIFATNFSGDPNRDRFKSPKRKGNLIIPDINLARDMIDSGFNVKLTNPREGEEEGFVPTYYVSVILNYDSPYPPTVYLVNDDYEPVLLDAESVGIIDKIRIKNVKCMLNAHEWEDGRFTAYVKTMYVEQDLSDDPFAAQYQAMRTRAIVEGNDEEEPF